MIDPKDFEWPYPTMLTDEEVEVVLARLESRAATAKAEIADRPGDYIAALAAASAEFVAVLVERRNDGSARGPFDAIEPEDFNDE
ncbi:MAG: hypothetical protein M3Q30_26310 [Actinomycetota bacterium]|nr:hypothetical protein [Actinomycetota bacterium]